MINKGLMALLFLLVFDAAAVPRDEIAEVLARQQTAWNRGDLDAYMQGYWNSERMLFVSNNKLRYGWSQTLAAYKKHYPDAAALGSLTFTIEEIKMLSNAAAMVVGRWALVREKDNPSGVFTLLVEKIDDLWVITHDHTSA